MAKFAKGYLDTMDRDVIALVTRIGALDNPGTHIADYSIYRDDHGAKRVYVQLIADKDFGEYAQTAIKDEIMGAVTAAKTEVEESNNG